MSSFCVWLDMLRMYFQVDKPFATPCAQILGHSGWIAKGIGAEPDIEHGVCGCYMY